MKLAVVRGKFLNPYEMQNFEPMVGRHEVVGFTSLRPLHDKFPFPVVKLPSPVDLPDFPNTRIKMGILNRIFVDAHYLFGLENRLKGFDIAHCAETYYHYTQQCLNAKTRGHVKKVVATVWENIPFNNEGIRGRKGFKERAIKEVDHFIAVTMGAKEALIKEECDPKKITIIPMGVDVNKFKMKPFDSAQGINEKLKVKNKEELEILFVGRLEEEKGVGELLEAFRMLVKETETRLKLRIIGKGSLHEYIVRRGREWGMDSQIIVEEKSYNEMPGVYQKADIFVLPSKLAKFWVEQFGMVLVEAMASGLPVVATKTGAIPEVVGETGILVAPGSSQALYRDLRRLVENPQLRLEFGKMGRKRAEEYFNSQKVARKIEEVYLNLLPELVEGLP